MLGGPAQQVVQSTNQNQQVPYIALITAQKGQSYIITYYQEQTFWLDDQNAKEACQNFIISSMDKVYLNTLYQPKIWYK